MLTSDELQHLASELKEMKKLAERAEENREEKESMKTASGELSMYDNHPADMGTELYEQEKKYALHEKATAQKEKIEDALRAIEDGTYGYCKKCQRPIAYERLAAIPYTTLCIDHAKEAEQPIEMDIAQNELENPFKSTSDPDAIDYENSFEEVAEFGTSDSPSDFTNPEKPSYMDDYD